jgi:proliferating cell nuclear antigen
MLWKPALNIGSKNPSLFSNVYSTILLQKDEDVLIQILEPTSLAFASKYISHFTKATPLSSSVVLSLKRDVPLMVEYGIMRHGHVRFYLAPKIDDDTL